MAFGVDVGLRAGHIVLDVGPSSPPKKGHSHPHNFRPVSVVAIWLDGSRWHLALRYASARAHCARWGRISPPLEKGAQPSSPNFWPMSVVAKRLDGSR